MNTNNPLRHKVLRFIKSNNLSFSGKNVLVSYSCGADSVFLMEVLFSLKKNLNINNIGLAFFDHGCGHDSYSTAVEHAKRYPVAQVFAVALGIKLEGSAGSFEERCRNARYAELQRIKEENDYDIILTGHNLTDQAETVLYKFITCGFIEGLIGIKAKREDNVIRPLLCLTREEIRRYLDESNISYWNDPSNNDVEMCVRNKLRHKVMPVLREINPRFEYAITKLSLGMQGFRLSH